MINLISKDLRKEEVYVQIAEQLNYLEKLTSESFEKINQKLRFFNDDLIKIEKRREIVKAKISQIKQNNKKAIQIQSPFYYPAKNIKENYIYESIVKNDHSFNPPTSQKQPQHSIEQAFELFHPDDLNEMLNFCDLDTFLKTERESLNFLQRQKLNKSTIPWNRIKTISSLIIFNSSETAYIKSDQDSSIYDFKIANKQKKSEEDDELNFGSFAPPKSMTKKEKFNSFEQTNLFKYDQQQAPKVLPDLPNDLPDLRAVADDIFFTEGSKFDFTIPTNLIEEEKETDQQLPSTTFRIFSSDQLSESSIEDDIKPLNNQMDKTSNINQSKTQMNSTSNPPPPPPMPSDTTNSSTFESSTELDKKIEEKKPLIQVDNSRASLLDAIRKAAGRPDKSKITIKEKKLEEKKSRKEAVSTDLMSDLKKVTIIFLKTTMMRNY